MSETRNTFLPTIFLLFSIGEKIVSLSSSILALSLKGRNSSSSLNNISGSYSLRGCLIIAGERPPDSRDKR